MIMRLVFLSYDDYYYYRHGWFVMSVVVFRRVRRVRNKSIDHAKFCSAESIRLCFFLLSRAVWYDHLCFKIVFSFTFFNFFH